MQEIEEELKDRKDRINDVEVKIQSYFAHNRNPNDNDYEEILELMMERAGLVLEHDCLNDLLDTVINNRP